MTMIKEINLDQTLYEILNQYPELIDVFYDFGFTQIKLPGMIQTAGRLMTLRQGCELRKFDLNSLINVLKLKGFTVKKD